MFVTVNAASAPDVVSVSAVAILVVGSAVFGVLEWRGVIRTPWDNARPGSAAASFAIVLTIAWPFVAASLIEILGPLPDAARAPVALLGALGPTLLFAAATVYLIATSTPPRWAVPPRLRGALDINRARKARRR